MSYIIIFMYIRTCEGKLKSRIMTILQRVIVVMLQIRRRCHRPHSHPRRCCPSQCLRRVYWSTLMFYCWNDCMDWHVVWHQDRSNRNKNHTWCSSSCCSHRFSETRTTKNLFTYTIKESYVNRLGSCAQDYFNY